MRAFTGLALRAAVALGAGADAEDVVQQAFFKAYCSLGRFRDGSALKPWLLSIVANETRNTVRSAVRQRSLVGREAALAEAEPLIPESADPAVAALAGERRAALYGELERWLGDKGEGRREEPPGLSMSDESRQIRRYRPGRMWPRRRRPPRGRARASVRRERTDH